MTINEDNSQLVIREGDRIVSHDRSRTLARANFSMVLVRGCRDFGWTIKTDEPLVDREPLPVDPEQRDLNHCRVTADYVAGDFTIWRMISGDPATAFSLKAMFKEVEV